MSKATLCLWFDGGAEAAARDRTGLHRRPPTNATSLSTTVHVQEAH